MTVTGPSEVNPKDMMRGINNVGEGWRPLVRELEVKLLELDPDYTLQQVKEKFGGLRYYAQTDDVGVFTEFHALITEAEDKSLTVCEVCGEPGDLNAGSHSWFKTLCEKHIAEREERYRREREQLGKGQ